MGMLGEFIDLFRKDFKAIDVRDDGPSGQLDPTPLDSRASQMIVLPWENKRESYPDQDYNAMVNAYKSWIYVCASKNANSVANATLKLYASTTNQNQKFLVKTKSIDKITENRIKSFPHLQPYVRKAVEIKEILEHPFYDLMRKVNPLTNQFDLWDMTQTFLELTGNAYWFVSKDRLRVPNEIWIIPSQYMIVAVDREKLILGYVFKRGSYTIPFEYGEIIHFKFSNPRNQIYGVSPLSAIYDTYRYDQNIRIFEDTLMQNNGRPEAVIQTDQVVGPDVFRRFKEEWSANYGGLKRAGKTMILEQGLTYKPITMAPKDMNFLNGRKMNREEIAAAFGVPMSKLTSDSVNLANAQVGEVQYTKGTIEPKLRRLEEKINERLISMYGDNLFVAYESTVPEDKEFELKERESRLKTYVTSINEEREKMGMEPVEWGDIPLVSGGVAHLGSQQEPEYNDEFLMSFVDGVVKSVREKIKK